MFKLVWCKKNKQKLAAVLGSSLII